jgi:hypothetical protein
MSALYSYSISEVGKSLKGSYVIFSVQELHLFIFLTGGIIQMPEGYTHSCGILATV